MSRNITITLKEEVARWAKVWAAEHDTSVSRFLADLLEERMVQERRYQAGMRRYLSRRPAPLRERGVAYPARTDLHER